MIKQLSATQSFINTARRATSCPSRFLLSCFCCSGFYLHLLVVTLSPNFFSKLCSNCPAPSPRCVSRLSRRRLDVHNGVRSQPIFTDEFAKVVNSSTFCTKNHRPQNENLPKDVPCLFLFLITQANREKSKDAFVAFPCGMIDEVAGSEKFVLCFQIGWLLLC